MPKIRGIKPEFWTDEDIVELSIPARLLFIGLWNFACDNGHLQDKPRQLKMRILPGDDVKVGELLDELVGSGRIARESGWILVPKFSKHQRIDKRYFTICDRDGCDRPGSDSPTSQRESHGAHSGNTSGARRDPSGTTTSAPGDGDGDSDGDGDGDRSDSAAPTRKRATKLPKDWKPTNDHLERALAADLVLGREADKFRSHADEKGRTAKNWNAAFTRWLMNAEDYAGHNRAPQRHLQSAAQIEEPPDGLNAEQYQAWSYDQAAKRKAAQQ